MVLIRVAKGSKGLKPIQSLGSNGHTVVSSLFTLTVDVLMHALAP